MHTDCNRVSSCTAQVPQAIANGNSSAPSQPVEIATKVYIRQPVDAARKAPAQMGAGASLPSMLSRPLSAQLQKAQEQHRSMVQVGILQSPYQLSSAPQFSPFPAHAGVQAEDARPQVSAVHLDLELIMGVRRCASCNCM